MTNSSLLMTIKIFPLILLVVAGMSLGTAAYFYDQQGIQSTKASGLVSQASSLPAASATSGPTVVAFTSSNPQTIGEFGLSVAVSGDVVVVGAAGESVGGFSNAGRAYIFSATGSPIATLTSPNPQTNGDFGFSVAVSGGIVVVGADQENAVGLPAVGHAYIFTTTGALVATLTSPNPEINIGGFGFSVAVSGGIVVVGAHFERGGGFDLAGHVYVFTTTGALIATLTSPNPQIVGNFGYSVAVDGTIVVVGAVEESAAGFSFAGRAYIFNTSGSLIANLTSPNPQDSGGLGSSVAVSGTTVVVGTLQENAAGFFAAGRAYIFNTSGALVANLVSPNPEDSGLFGSSVAVSGPSVVVGAWHETGSGVGQAGHAYIFSTTGSPIATLTSPNPQTNGFFGISVAVSGTSVVVGAWGESSAGVPTAGNAYLFVLRPSTRTIVSCNPSTVAVNQASTCTATVADTSSTPTSPSGTVTFSSGSLGSFGPSNTCTLSPTGSSNASCASTVSYTPSPGSEGTHAIAGTYGGDTGHFGSSGTFSLSVTMRTSSIIVNCSASMLTDHHTTPCTAIVRDRSPGTRITPTGTVDWKSSGKGTFSSTSCTLTGAGPTATCTVTYTSSPGKPLPQTITGTYNGDKDHFGSEGITSITTP